MDPDLSLVIGLVIAVFAIPAIVSAVSDGRPPRVAALALIVSGGFLVFAINAKDGGYRMQDLPQVVFGVIGRFIG